MRITIDLSTAKVRHLHSILFTAATLLGLSLQSDVSGYICDNHIVIHQEAQKAAHFASELLTPANPHYMYPALLEDTQLFGVENRNLFVVPFKNNKSFRNGGKPGSDRVVIDDQGNFMGVLTNVNNEASVVPLYKKCTTFLTYDKLNFELDVRNAYKPLGFACGSNFLSTEIEDEMKSKCNGLENLSHSDKEFYQFLERKGITWSENKFWYKYLIKKDYNYPNTKRAAIYRIEFTSQCILIQVKLAVRSGPSEPACLEIWTPKPSVDINSLNLSLNSQNQNQESSDTYSCKEITFRMTTLQNYLTQYHNLLSTASSMRVEATIIRQNYNLILWPIFSPDRFIKKPNYRTKFAMGFDKENNFLGLYYMPARNPAGKLYKQCLYPELLKAFLEDKTSTERDPRTRDLFF